MKYPFHIPFSDEEPLSHASGLKNKGTPYKPLQGVPPRIFNDSNTVKCNKIRIFFSMLHTMRKCWDFSSPVFYLQMQAVRVEVACKDADETNPLVLVARLQKGVLSWAIPLLSEKG